MAVEAVVAEEEETLLDEQHRINFRRSASNTTSLVAMVGAHVCPIESLDYELIENDRLLQAGLAEPCRAHIFRYVTLTWSLCFLIGALAGAVGFFNNLAVENIAGVKFVVTSNMMLARKYGWAFAVFAVSNFVLTMFASVITAYLGPAAAGSGILEVKAYPNGVDAPHIFSLRTLVVKPQGRERNQMARLSASHAEGRLSATHAEGRPAIRSQTRGWASASVILGVELCERLTTLVIAVNLIYWTGTMDLGNATSANTVTNFLGTSFVLCLLGGFLAVSFLGRNLTIAIFTALQTLGITILMISMAALGLRPPASVDPSAGGCMRAIDAHFGVLCLALNLTVWGTGGLKSSVSGFGSDRCDESDRDERRQWGIKKRAARERPYAVLQEKLHELESMLNKMFFQSAKEADTGEFYAEITARIDFLKTLHAAEMESNAQGTLHHLHHIARKLAALEDAFHNWLDSGIPPKDYLDDLPVYSSTYSCFNEVVEDDDRVPESDYFVPTNQTEVMSSSDIREKRKRHQIGQICCRICCGLMSAAAAVAAVAIALGTNISRVEEERFFCANVIVFVMDLFCVSCSFPFFSFIFYCLF